MSIRFRTWSGLSQLEKRDQRKKSKQAKRHAKANTSEVKVYSFAEFSELQKSEQVNRSS